MESPSITVEPHPLLALGAFATSFPGALGTLSASATLSDLLRLDTSAPLSADDAVRQAIRGLLRYGGYKPTGRGKPASEYLLRAATEGTLGAINLAVDACNAVSLHSGLPISVVDLDRLEPPLRIAIAAEGTSYPFNAAGQEIALAGLVCLHDRLGPCANAVKDSQRTKTQADTSRTVTLIWGTHVLPGRTGATVAWYRHLLAQLGAETVECSQV
jgi:DNA/RNA-binding domain of Phe-tRNA-synthetase-like protein